MADEVKADALQTTNPDYEQIGKAILGRAVAKQNEEAQDAVIDGVQAMLRDIDEQCKLIRRAQDRITKQQERIAALEAGKFKIDVVEQTVQFDDDSLNGGGL